MNWYFRVLDWERSRTGHQYMAKGLLVSPSGTAWDAVSGPFTKGVLPQGEYVISNCRLRTGTAMRAPMSDLAGNFWSCDLSDKPEFGRDLLRIHPDGNGQGTEGCIGLTQRDTLEVFQALQHSSSSKLIVEFIAPTP